MSNDQVEDCCRDKKRGCKHSGENEHNRTNQPGKSFPLGSTVLEDGINFSVFATCSELELLLFDAIDAEEPSQTIRLDHTHNRTFHYWHVFVTGLKAGQVYAYRTAGQKNDLRVFQYHEEKVLLDPYSRGVVNAENYSRARASAVGSNCQTAFRSVAIGRCDYDWAGDVLPRTSYAKSIIYEMHVKGFTKHASSGVPLVKRGTFAGLQEKIPYLKRLGITAVELMPIQFFDSQDAPEGLSNYWGYSPLAYFSLHSGYAAATGAVGIIDEFRDLVKALHKEGIEVILDVVFNHSGEGSELGPIVSLKGLANSTYYIVDSIDGYADFSGCGNSLRGNNSVCQRLILDCLRYWVSEMHVDGFRFDLASTLSRDASGKPQSIELSSVLSAIESDPVLAGSKLIAEAWDATGFYQIGSFINSSDWFAEWNGPFRDDIRKFLKGDNGSAKAAAERIAGSSDIYSNSDREPHRSIHFVTCHDGFTLRDLVSYNQKHNMDNGENNADGNNSNFSWNCGFEGPSENCEVKSLRSRQIKNFLTVLFFSQGTPMLLMGDEIGRTQQGNNNAYCQDNEISWFDWKLAEKNASTFEFVSHLAAFRKACPLLQQNHLLCKMTKECCCPRIVWHGIKLGLPDWSETSHSLAYSLIGASITEGWLHIMVNAFWHPLTFEIPVINGYSWRSIIDTMRLPNSFQDAEVAEEVKGNEITVGERSVTVLFAVDNGLKS